MSRSGRTCAVVAVAGWGGEDLFFFNVFHSDSSGVAWSEHQERGAVPDRSRGLDEGLGRFAVIGAHVAVAITKRRWAFSPLCHTVERFSHFAGRERLFNGGTIAKAAKVIAGSITVETLDDLSVLLYK
jgi:hypothetical protein